MEVRTHQNFCHSVIHGINAEALSYRHTKTTANMGSSAPSLRVLSLFVAGLLHSTQVFAESTSDAITCFYYDGEQAANNTLCPGSSSCCGITATCVSNRLCHNAGDASNIYVRGPCAVNPATNGWDSSCAQVCLYGRCYHLCCKACIAAGLATCVM